MLLKHPLTTNAILQTALATIIGSAAFLFDLYISYIYKNDPIRGAWGMPDFYTTLVFLPCWLIGFFEISRQARNLILDPQARLIRIIAIITGLTLIVLPISFHHFLSQELQTPTGLAEASFQKRTLTVLCNVGHFPAVSFLGMLPILLGYLFYLRYLRYHTSADIYYSIALILFGLLAASTLPQLMLGKPPYETQGIDGQIMGLNALSMIIFLGSLAYMSYALSEIACRLLAQKDSARFQAQPIRYSLLIFGAFAFLTASVITLVFLAYLLNSMSYFSTAFHILMNNDAHPIIILFCLPIVTIVFSKIHGRVS